MRRFFHRSVDFVLVAGICFLLLEIFSRVYFHYFWYLTPYNSAAAWRIVWAHRPRGELYAPLEMFDPLLGWKNRPNFRNDEPLFGADRVSTNAQGARNSLNYSYSRTEKSRIVIIGDSFAFGAEVNDDETFAARLEASLPNTEVINLAVIGYGIDQMLLTIKQEALKFSPDLIIVGFISGDLDRSLVSFRDFAKPIFVSDSGKLKLINTPVPEPQVWMASEFWRSKAIDMMEIAFVEVTRRVGIRQRQAFEITMMLWDEMVRSTREANSVLMLMFEPSGAEIILDDRADLVAARTESEAYRANSRYFASGASTVGRYGEKLFLDYTQANGIKSLNLGPVFRKLYRDGDMQIAKDGHWNSHGHAVAAAEIERKLLGEGWPKVRLDR